MNTKTVKALLLLTGMSLTGQAAILYYGTGSSAVWNTSTANWGTGTGGPYTSAYGGAYEDAVFEGTGKAVTVSSVNANSISILSSGYSLSSGTITLGSPTGGPAINVGTGLTASIASVLDRAGDGAALRKTGSGTLTYTGLSVINGYSVTVEGGTLAVASGGRLWHDTTYQSASVLTVSTGATLDLQTWGYGTGQSLGALRTNTDAIAISGGTIRMSGGSTSYNRGMTVNSGGATFEAATGATWEMLYNAGTENVYSGNPSLTFTGAGNGRFEKLLNGSGGLTKSGAGTWTLTRANTYTGNTTVSGGTLKITGRIYDSSHSNAQVSVQTGGVLELDTWSYGSGTQSLGMLAAGAGQIVINNGTIRMTGTTSYGRGVTVQAGGATFEAAAGANWTQGGGGYVANIYTDNPSLTFTGAGNGTFDKVFSGSGSLTKTGTGTWTLSSANTNSGGLTIKAGTLAGTTDTSALGGSGTGAVTLGDTSGTASATLTGDTRTFANPITVAAGSSGNTLTLGNSGSSSAVFSGLITQNNTNTRLTLKGAGTGSVNASNTISGNGGLALSSDSNGTVTLGGANTFMGGVLFNSGTLNLNNNAALGNGAGMFTINGGTTLKNTSGSTKTVANNNPITLNGDFTFSGSNTVNLGNGAVSLGSAAGTARTITATSSTLTLGGILSNGMTATGLTKAGAGTLVLSGASDYTGGVSITGGTLSVNSVASSATAQPLGKGTSAVQLSSGATLAVTAGGTTSRGLSLMDASGGKVDITGGTTLSMSSISGPGADFHKNGSGTFAISESSAVNNLLVNVGTYRQTGGTTVINSTTFGLKIADAANTGYRLEAGTLRTNKIDMPGAGTFRWGAGILTMKQEEVGVANGIDRTGSTGAASGPVVREGTRINVTGNLTTTSGSILDLGPTYYSNARLYDNLSITGNLDLSAAGDTLNFEINPYFLRPSGPNDVERGDWGTLVLVRATSITGAFNLITGIGNDPIGWTQHTAGFTSAANLPLNTWYVQTLSSFDDGLPGVSDVSAVVLFHYKVAGSVPEPASAGLMVAGALVLRALRRRK